MKLTVCDIIAFIGILGLPSATYCAPMDHRQSFGAPEPDEFIFNHHESFELNRAHHGFSNQPPLHDWRYPPSTQGHNFNQQDGNRNIAHHTDYQQVIDYGNIPKHSSGAGPSHEVLNDHFHYSNPNAFVDLLLSDEYGKDLTSDNLNQYEQQPAYNDFPKPASPLQSESPTHTDSSSEAGNPPDSTLDSEIINGREKIPESELSIRTERLNKYNWQKFYHTDELVRLYKILFIWRILPGNTAKDCFNKINKNLARKPNLIDEILYGHDEEKKVKLAEKWGPKYVKKTVQASLPNRKYVFNKERYITWILSSVKPYRRAQYITLA